MTVNFILDPIQSRRKVSSLSDRSDNSEVGQHSGGEESPGILSDDQPPESPSTEDNDDTGKNFPWLKSVVEVINSFNFYCTHQGFCHPYCYRRNTRAASRIIRAIRKVSFVLLSFIRKFITHTVQLRYLRL